MKESTWVLCPVCHNKTRTKIIDNTECSNFPLNYPKCKQENLIDVKNYRITIIKESDEEPITIEAKTSSYRLFLLYKHCQILVVNQGDITVMKLIFTQKTKMNHEKSIHALTVKVKCVFFRLFSVWTNVKSLDTKIAQILERLTFGAYHYSEEGQLFINAHPNSGKIYMYLDHCTYSAL